MARSSLSSVSSIEFSNLEEDIVFLLIGLGILGDLGLLGLRNPGDNLEGMTLFIVRQANVDRAVCRTWYSFSSVVLFLFSVCQRMSHQILALTML